MSPTSCGGSARPWSYRLRPGPVEREQRRAATRKLTHPVPTGLLPAAAIDGKLLHGTVTPTGRVFLVAAIAHETGAVLGQRQVADKQGEGTVIDSLLSGLDVAGMVLTLDALHTTKKTARLITDTLNAHYLLILKANQCATRRSVVSPLQAGGTRREVPGSDGLPGAER